MPEQIMGGTVLDLAQMSVRWPLPHGYSTQVNVADLLSVRPLALYRGNNGYAYFTVWADGKATARTLHGLLMPKVKGMHVDHINGDKLDNRRVNLRSVTPQMNQVNRKNVSRANTSGHRGVCPSKRPKPWRAQITVNYRNIYLGDYWTLELAVAARKAAERKYFGEECP